MATSTVLVTVEEFRKLEDPPGVRLELHHGEVVEVTRPKFKHWILQMAVTDLFKAAFGDRGMMGPEYAFRPLPEHEVRVADVAWVSDARSKQQINGDPLGAPEIIVEVLSPSNTSSELLDKKHLCFANGCQEFWIVDPKRRFIEIEHNGGGSRVYRGSDRIEIGAASASVDELFRKVD